jgi:3-hydroxyisobutyrate dehydrogenase
VGIQKVGFLGLGLMGSRMARNLARKGFDVTVWNRSPREGIRLAATPAALAAEVDAFCTCVADPPALRDVALGKGGLLEGARQGQLFVDFSTVSAELSRELEATFGEKGVGFVEAPVTGSKNGAEKGTLLIMSGASPEAFARAQPLFAAVGEKAIHCGPVGAGTQVKLAGNVLISVMLEGLSEGMLLAQKAGVDPRKVLEVVQASGFRSPYFDFKGKQLLEHDFATHFSIDLMFKDLCLFLDSAARHRVPTPLAAAVRESYQLARSAGLGEQDIAATVVPLEQLCGTRIQ